MRPEPPFVMGAALKTLEEIAEGSTDAQEISRLRGVSSLLSILQREWDTCASTRLAGISRYTDIVRRGSELMTGAHRAHLEQVLAEAARTGDDYRISSLESTLDGLRAAVVDLQSWIENVEGEQERSLLASIWQAEYADAESEDRNHFFW
jgi:hypothetical protein